MKNSSQKRTLSRALAYIRGYWLLITLSLIFALITSAITLYIPIVVGNAIDAMLGAGRVDFKIISAALVKIAAVAVVGAILQWLMAVINNRITFHVVRDIRNDAFKKLHALPIKYIDSHRHGDIISRIVNDAEQFSDGLLLGFSQLFSGIVTIIGTLIFMLYIRWEIALIVIFLTPLSLFVARFIASRTHRLFVRRAQDTGAATGYINEMINNQRVTVAFSNEEKAVSDFEDVNSRLEKSTLGAIFYSSLVNPTTRFINSVVYAAVGLGGAIFAILGRITVGSLTCFLSYAGQYAKPFNEISGVITELQNALACSGRIFELMDEREEEPSAEAVGHKAVGNIEFENVSFSYTEDKPLLKNISLSVKAGAHVAIVGPTGCGKTTLINLLMRFYDVTGGKITLDGRDIRDIKRAELRESFGMVLQDTWLSVGTVRENIAMGKPNATDEEIISAAKAAHAHGFIMRLKNGYDTPLSESGDGLSQGEKQLLCIARIMLASPPMLILDEATSSIDTRTELKIQDAFAHLMHGKTTFIVAHRLSTVRDADIILVMKDGNIIEKGCHGELLAQNGFYSTLYNSQFAGRADL